MKLFSFLFSRLKRLIIAILYQVPWVLLGVALYFYAHHTFADKIQSAFGIVEAQDRLAQATQATAFMKNMISVSNPVASINYLTSLVTQTTAWTRLNSSQMFANVATSLSLWLVDAFLFIGGIYLVWHVFKLYRQRGRQLESADLVAKELKPYFQGLQNEIQTLCQEIQDLKNEQNNPTNSPDTRR